jgi:Asp/Glu/hydantoin racemase
MLDEPFAAITSVQEEKESRLLALCDRAVREDEADVIVLGGAPLAGLAGKLRDRVPVPLVDQVQAAVKQAEALVALAPRKATAGTFRRPPAKPSTGLSAALAARISHTDG